MVDIKSKLKSRTLWLNGLITLAGVLTFMTSPEAKLDAQTVGIAGSVLGVVNFVLRLLTTKPVIETKEN